jgi:hypothetical protein
MMAGYDDLDPRYQPVITTAFNGFYAHGNGWAVFGRTADEALANFRRRQLKYIEIHAREREADRRNREAGR